jgi:hypothetical protein
MQLLPTHHLKSWLATSASIARMQTACFLLACIVLFIGWHHIHTYVTGQDSATYIRIARSILSANGPREAFAAACSKVAPGYPLLLAGAMRIAGPFAPYLIQPVIGIVTLFILWRLSRRLSDNPWFPPLVLAGFLWITFIGCSTNAYFLLYPFRECLALLMLYLAFLAWLRAIESTPPCLPWLLISGATFLATAVIREPFALSIAGPALVMLARIRRDRVPAIATFLTLPATAVACFAVLIATHQIAPPMQLLGWFLPIAQGSSNTNVWLVNMKANAALFSQEWSLPLLAAGILGIWNRRRDTRFHALVAVPLVMIMLFYSTFELHKRYAMVPLLMFSPYVADGILYLIDVCCRRFKTLYPLLATALPATAILTALGLTLHAASNLTPLSPYTSRSSIRKAVRQIETSMGTNTVTVFTELLCRTFGDLIYHYTPHRLGDAWDPALCNSHAPMFYAEPLNEDSVERAKIRLPVGIPVKTILEDRFDVTPLRGENNEHTTITYGWSAFAVYTVAQWTNTCLTLPLDTTANQPASIWLDFGSSPDTSPRTIHLILQNGDVIAEWNQVCATGIHAIHISPAQSALGPLALRLSSRSPMPAQPLLHTEPDQGFTRFSLESKRRVSALHWFPPPFLPIRWLARSPVVMHDHGRITLPRTYGPISTIDMAVEITPIAPQTTNTDITLTFTSNGRLLTNVTASLDHTFGALVSLPPPADGQSALVDISTSSLPPDTLFRFRRIAFRFLSSNVTPEGAPLP